MSDIELVRTALTALWRVTSPSQAGYRKLEVLKTLADKADTLAEMRVLVRLMDIAMNGIEADYDRMLRELEAERL